MLTPRLSQILLRLLAASLFAISMDQVVAAAANARDGKLISLPLNRSADNLIPKDFDAVRIGSNAATLSKSRNQRPQALIEDPGQRPKVLIEKKLGGKYFDTAMYGFSDVVDKLISITFTGSVSRVNAGSALVDFKSALLREWGWPDQIVIENQGGQEFATPIWNRDEVTIAASYIADVQTVKLDAPVFFQLRFFSKELPISKVLRGETKTSVSISTVTDDLKRLMKSVEVRGTAGAAKPD